ncbi:MAG: pilus assembly protein [Acidimicrobiia bacterium]|nr:pilus assembly protein [Acidimicrobiia bacterium]
MTDEHVEISPRGRRYERGAGGVELAVAFTSLLLALFFVVGALRVSTTRSDVSAAARAAARAASQAYDASDGSAEAARVAEDALVDRGVGCRELGVAASGDYRPGAIVTVTVTCTVDLGDVALVGFPGTETVTATAAEMVDVIRGGG